MGATPEGLKPLVLRWTGRALAGFNRALSYIDAHKTFRVGSAASSGAARPKRVVHLHEGPEHCDHCDWELNRLLLDLVEKGFEGFGPKKWAPGDLETGLERPGWSSDRGKMMLS